MLWIPQSLRTGYGRRNMKVSSHFKMTGSNKLPRLAVVSTYLFSAPTFLQNHWTLMVIRLWHRQELAILLIPTHWSLSIIEDTPPMAVRRRRRLVTPLLASNLILITKEQIPILVAHGQGHGRF